MKLLDYDKDALEAALQEIQYSREFLELAVGLLKGYLDARDLSSTEEERLGESTLDTTYRFIGGSAGYLGMMVDFIERELKNYG